MCRTLSSMPFMTKFALFGIGIPFLVYTSYYILSRIGVTITLGQLDNRSSMKLAAVVTSSVTQIAFAVVSAEVKRIFYRTIRGKVNFMSAYIGMLASIPIFLAMLYSWNKSDRFGSAYVDSFSGVFNGIIYQIGWFIFPYFIIAGLYGISFKFSISNRRHQAAKLRGDHGRGK